MLSTETNAPAKPARPLNEMKCPFRMDENGEFMPCCGDACMAYYEFEHTPWTLTNIEKEPPPPVLVRLCRRLPPAYTPYGYAV